MINYKCISIKESKIKKFDLLKFSNDGKYLAVLGPQRNINIYNGKNFNKIDEIDPSYQPWLLDLLRYHNGKQIITGDDGQIKIRNS